MRENNPRVDIECVLSWKAQLGESPVWHPGEQRLYWVDLLGKRIHRFDPVTRRNESFELPEVVPCLIPRIRGGLLLTLRKNFAFFDPATAELQRLAEIESDLPLNRFNDGKCDPRGRFWAGTMNEKNWNQPDGNLYSFGPDLVPRKKISGVVCSNGTDWSPDGHVMYHTESFRYTIFAADFDPASGEVSNRRPFVTLEPSMGNPDGLTVDDDGFIWSCIVGPGRIHRYDPAGRLERVISMPVSRATSCAFGGPDLKTLFVTSSQQTLTVRQWVDQPGAGGLFAVNADIRGRAPYFFEG